MPQNVRACRRIRFADYRGNYNAYDIDATGAKVVTRVSTTPVHQFCSMGALEAAAKGANGFEFGNVWYATKDSAAYRVESALIRAMDYTRIATFNDNHSHAEVIAAWKAAGTAEGWL